MGEARLAGEGSLSDLWQLYTYLGDKCDSYSRTSFEDFSLLFSTGALAAWVPASGLVPAQALDGWAPLAGFVAILFFIVIVGARDLAKQALIGFYLAQLARVEARIAARLGEADGEAYGFARQWPRWQKACYEPLMQRFLLLFAVFLLGVPTATLWLGSGPRQAIAYLVAFVVATGIYVSAAAQLKQPAPA